ncbi:MAG TPA: hypothetical protein VFA64_04510 [Hyphomicrobiaceae bacterium]|nr:hypothetical protein [Hyphomicrobiaceae bacterium]
MKPFTMVTALLLLAAAIVHALRLGLGWSVSVGAIDIPVWASAVGLVVAAGLGLGLMREARTRPASAAGAPAAGGLSLNQLGALLDVNETVRMSSDVLARAFPPSLKDEQARNRLEAVAKEHNRQVSIDPRTGTVRFEPRLS